MVGLDALSNDRMHRFKRREWYLFGVRRQRVQNLARHCAQKLVSGHILKDVDHLLQCAELGIPLIFEPGFHADEEKTPPLEKHAPAPFVGLTLAHDSFRNRQSGKSD